MSTVRNLTRLFSRVRKDAKKKRLKGYTQCVHDLEDLIYNADCDWGVQDGPFEYFKEYYNSIGKLRRFKSEEKAKEIVNREIKKDVYKLIHQLLTYMETNRDIKINRKRLLRLFYKFL